MTTRHAPEQLGHAPQPIRPQHGTRVGRRACHQPHHHCQERLDPVLLLPATLARLPPVEHGDVVCEERPCSGNSAEPV